MSDIQTSKIIKMLRKNHRSGIENYRFAQAGILRYSSRINELRRDGYNILTVRDHLPNGRATNVFRYFLVEENNKDGLTYEETDIAAVDTNHPNRLHRVGTVLQTALNLKR